MTKGQLAVFGDSLLRKKEKITIKKEGDEIFYVASVFLVLTKINERPAVLALNVEQLGNMDFC